MKGRAIPLSPSRIVACDFLRLAKDIPTVPVQKQMDLGAVVAARASHLRRPSWSAIFIKAYGLLAAEVPELRRTYVKLWRHHLYEYPTSVAGITIERDLQGEKGVVLAKIKNPARLSIFQIHQRILECKVNPIEENKDFLLAQWIVRLAWPIRHVLWWLALNFGRRRARYFGTFTLSVYSALGAESLHPLTPTTTTLNYGVIDSAGNVSVRIIYDHRVMDGATVARALGRLEEILNTAIVEELNATAGQFSQAA